jgi:hypothetical protein
MGYSRAPYLKLIEVPELLYIPRRWSREWDYFRGLMRPTARGFATSEPYRGQHVSFWDSRIAKSGESIGYFKSDPTPISVRHAKFDRSKCDDHGRTGGYKIRPDFPEEIDALEAAFLVATSLTDDQLRYLGLSEEQIRIVQK